MKFRIFIFLFATATLVAYTAPTFHYSAPLSILSDTSAVEVLDLDDILKSLEKDTAINKDSVAQKAQANILAVAKKLEKLNKRLETLKDTTTKSSKVTEVDKVQLAKNDSVKHDNKTEQVVAQRKAAISGELKNVPNATILTDSSVIASNTIASVNNEELSANRKNEQFEDTVKNEVKSISLLKQNIVQVADSAEKKIQAEQTPMAASKIANTITPTKLKNGNGKTDEIKTPSLSDIINSLAANIVHDSTPKRTVDSLRNTKIATYEDSLIYRASPFFIDLIYMGKSLPLNFKRKTTSELFFGRKATHLDDSQYFEIKRAKFNDVTSQASLITIRKDARDYITRTRADLYQANVFDLPSTEINKYRFIPSNKMNKVQFVDENLTMRLGSKLEVEKPKLDPWQKTANVMTQFTQNHVSNNWYQGGVSTMTILNIVAGTLNYTNEKIQWTNTAEWRMGMLGTPNDTTVKHMYYMNDDVFKIESKFGVKAIGNWSYTALLNFSTQFFDNIKNNKSDDLKAKFLSPMRLNFGIGMGYNYKKMWSVTLAPVSYKLIYLTTPMKDSPSLFGIDEGARKLSEIGSSLNAQLNWKPFPELQLNSTFKFYTNYEKVEIDWEIVANFTVNRFLSTRLSLNPRYDNTVILTGEEKASMQFKELLSFGFNFRLI